MEVISDGMENATKKDTKYDRQLRLWGARGQRALMESRILLINAGKSLMMMMMMVEFPPFITSHTPAHALCAHASLLQYQVQQGQKS